MSISKETILQDKYATNVIQSLSDNPNESGLDAENLKIAFDAGATHIKNYIHDDLIDDINSEIATVSTSIGNTNTTIGQLENLTTTNKSNVVSAVNEVNEDSGWIDITPIEQPTKWQYLRCRKKGKMVCLEGRAGYSANPPDFVIGNGSGSTTISFVSKTIGTIPEGYRPHNTIHAIFPSAGKRITRYVFGSEGTIVLDYGINLANGNYLVNEKTWTSFEITYFID